MSPAQQAALVADIVALVEEESNVVRLRAKQDGGTLEEHGDFHRAAAAEYDRRRAQARRDGKAAAKKFREERAEIKRQFDEDMAAVSAREAQAKAEMAERIATAETLAEVSRAAVTRIERALS